MSLQSSSTYLYGRFFGMTGSHLCPRVTVLVACVLLFSGIVHQVSAVTRSADVDALNGLSREWSASPPLNWGVGDPCGVPWDGVWCDASNSTVEQLILDAKGLNGQISSAVGNLTGLKTLEMSSNLGLTGPIPHEIGLLTKLVILSIQYCSLLGPLPSELGDILGLDYLGLNGNNITGPIPASLGKTNLTWLDVSTNFLSGPIPISNASNPIGLDNITSIEHFHLNNNSFNGTVPAELFSLPNIYHVLLNFNQLNGSLPNVSSSTWSRNLTIIRLDNNQLSDKVPQGFADVPGLMELHLEHNRFSGPVPNFSYITSLNVLGLSDNNFDPEPSFPQWLLQFSNLTTLNLAQINLSGEIPSGLFNLSSIEAIDLSSNKLNGSLNFVGKAGSSLQTLNVQNNDIKGFSGDPGRNFSIWLQANPICQNNFFSLPTACAGEAAGTWVHPAVSTWCTGQSNSCGSNMSLNWYTCRCAYPLALELLLTAPTFGDLNKGATDLERDLAVPLNLTNQTFVSNMLQDGGYTIKATLWVFPVSGNRLTGEQSNKIILALRHHNFSLPEGPYLLLDSSTSGNNHKSKLSTGAIIGIVVGATAGCLIVAASIIFAVVQKRRADKAVMNNPFASWGGGSAEFGEAPKLKGARWFSLAELKQYTDNWSDDNMIGVGGYGKVYRGTLPDGDLVAIKRAVEGSMQGANEFKNEIELLSRVHHRNLVGLVGFCYEGGEQALIYEFMSNGNLNDHLKGYVQVPLSWDARLEIALASAIGINYLHDHASPPIIHRDIKSANILLNEKMVAKVADFGLSKLAPDEGEKLVHSVNVKGTMGYLDPEYYMTQILTDKSDVYSFGVVLLELLTARPPIEHGRYVVRDFRNALDRGGIEALRPLLDPVLQDLSTGELEPFLKIALSCVEEAGDGRPNTAELVKSLHNLKTFSKRKGGVRAMDIEGGGKKVKFADEFVNENNDLEDLLSGDMAPKESPEVSYPYQRAGDSFRYSGAYGVSTTVKPK